jgi:hypothetical protein
MWSSEGSFMLDLDLHFNNDFVLMTYFTSFDIIFDLIRWHIRLGYIGQDRLARLARDGLLGSLTKISMPI